jgi:hypothetical protein
VATKRVAKPKAEYKPPEGEVEWIDDHHLFIGSETYPGEKAWYVNLMTLECGCPFDQHADDITQVCKHLKWAIGEYRKRIRARQVGSLIEAFGGER